MSSHSKHFLRDALTLGDKRPVVTTTAIYSNNHIKLVDAGTRVTSALYERLVRHKLLMPPIEQCLKVGGGVDAGDLVQRVKALLEGEPHFARMCNAIPKGTLIAAFQNALLLPPLAFKLTVAREQRPNVFAHSLEVALIAAYLQGMSSQRIPDLALAATAGLLQDIGLLHISPDILIPGQALAVSDRLHIYTHPITAHLIVREFTELHPVVSTAILEHHERMDGSGYPHSVQGDKISELGRILMLADSGAALLKSSVHGQGGIALRLLPRKFNPKLLDHLARLFGPVEEQPGEGAAQAHELALRQLNALAEILLAWDIDYAELRGGPSDGSDNALVGLVNQRVVALERSLLESGFVANQLETFVSAAAQDESGVQEMRELAREGVWQLKDITFEARRRWPDARQADAVHPMIARWLGQAEERLGSIRGTHPV